MKRKIVIIVGILVLAAQAVWIIPAFAAGSTGSTQPTQTAQMVNKTKILVRLMVVQDESKIDAFLAKAVSAGKLTADQSAKVKQLWVEHHAQFAPGSILVRLLKAKDGTRVDAFLDKAVTAGKIKQAQADKIEALWQQLHN